MHDNYILLSVSLPEFLLIGRKPAEKTSVGAFRKTGRNYVALYFYIIYRISRQHNFCKRSGGKCSNPCFSFARGVSCRITGEKSAGQTGRNEIKIGRHERQAILYHAGKWPKLWDGPEKCFIPLPMDRAFFPLLLISPFFQQWRGK